MSSSTSNGRSHTNEKGDELKEKLQTSIKLLKSEECIVTLLKVIDNILVEKAYTSKTRKLKLNNKVFNKKVARHNGGTEFLYACNFTKTNKQTTSTSSSSSSSKDLILELKLENESKWWLWHCRDSLYNNASSLDTVSIDLPPTPIKEPTKDIDINVSNGNNGKDGSDDALIDDAIKTVEKVIIDSENKNSHGGSGSNAPQQSDLSPSSKKSTITTRTGSSSVMNGFGVGGDDDDIVSRLLKKEYDSVSGHDISNSDNANSVHSNTDGTSVATGGKDEIQSDSGHDSVPDIDDGVLDQLIKEDLVKTSEKRKKKTKAANDNNKMGGLTSETSSAASSVDNKSSPPPLTNVVAPETFNQTDIIDVVELDEKIIETTTTAPDTKTAVAAGEETEEYFLQVKQDGNDDNSDVSVSTPHHDNDKKVLKGTSTSSSSGTSTLTGTNKDSKDEHQTNNEKGTTISTTATGPSTNASSAPAKEKGILGSDHGSSSTGNRDATPTSSPDQEFDTKSLHTSSGSSGGKTPKSGASATERSRQHTKYLMRHSSRSTVGSRSDDGSSSYRTRQDMSWLPSTQDTNLYELFVDLITESDIITKEIFESCWSALCILTISCSKLGEQEENDRLKLPNTIASSKSKGKHKKNSSSNVNNQQNKQQLQRPWVPIDIVHLLWKVVMVEEDVTTDGTVDLDDICSHLQEILIDNQALEMTARGGDCNKRKKSSKEDGETKVQQEANDGQDDEEISKGSDNHINEDGVIPHTDWTRIGSGKDALLRCGCYATSLENGSLYIDLLIDELQKDSTLWYSRYVLPTLLLSRRLEEQQRLIQQQQRGGGGGGCGGIVMSSKVVDNRVVKILHNEDFIQSRLNVLGIVLGTKRHITDCHEYVHAIQEEERNNRFKLGKNLSSNATRDTVDTVNNDTPFSVWESALEVALGAAQQVALCLYLYGQNLRKERDLQERMNVATALYELGMAVGDWGDYDFEMQLYSKTLTLRREYHDRKQHTSTGSDNANTISNEGDESIADTLLCMGTCHQSRGNNSAAMSCYEEAQDMYRKTLGSKHVKVAKVLHNMGIIHCENLELDTAMQCFKSSLKIRQMKQGGGDDSYDEHMADTLCWIGRVYREQKLLDKAFKYFVTARLAKEEIFGKESLEVAEILQNIAVIHDDHGEYDRALDLYSKSLRNRRRILGEEHEDICDLMTCMGNAFVRMGDTAMSLTLFRRALEMRTNLTRSTKLDEKETVILIHAHEDVLEALKERLAEEDDENLNSESLRDEVGNHLLKIGYLYDSINDYESCIDNFEKCLKIRMLLGDDIKTGQVMNATGIAHAKRQKYDEAFAVFKDALALRKETLGENHIDVAETLHNMGNCAAKSGDYGDARVYYDDALRIKKKILGSDHASVAQTLHNIGNIMIKQGHNDAAMNFYQNALDIRRTTLGEDNLDVAFSLHCVAKVHRIKNELRESLAQFEESLRIKKLNLSENHISVAETLEQLGATYLQTGEDNQAAVNYSGALNIYKSKLGNHLNTAIAYEALATIFQKQKDHSRALTYLQKALKVRNSAFGTDDIRIAETYYKIGKLHRDLGTTHEALSSFQQATRVRKKHAGRNDLMIADILTDAGELQAQVDQKQVAQKCFAEALRIRRFMLDTTHETIGESLMRVGDIQLDDGSHEQAIDSYTEAKHIFKVERGDKSPSFANACRKLGQAYHGQKEYDQAIEQYEEGINASVSANGQDTVEVADAYHDLGVLYNENGNYSKAEETLRKSCDIKMKVLGEDHVSVSESTLQLGRTCLKLQSPEEALMYFEQALLIKQQHLGDDDHVDCIDILRDIGSAHEMNSDYTESLSCYTNYLNKRRKLIGDDEVTADVLHSIGKVKQSMNDFNAALTSFESSLSLYKILLGNENLSVANTQYSIACVYEALGDFKDAMKYHKEAFRLRRTLLGSDDLCVATSLDNIAGLYLKESNTNKALQGLKEALRIRTEMLGSDAVEVGTTLFGMGVVFTEIGDLDKAMECYDSSLNIRKSKIGETSIEVAQTLHNMGTLYAKQSNYDSALEQWRDALKCYHDCGLDDDQHIVAITIGNINMAEGLMNDQNSVSMTVSSSETTEKVGHRVRNL